MMDVQVMRAVVDVLESDALPVAVSKAVTRWDGVDLRYVRSSANHVFRFSRADDICFLRLTPTTERSREAIQAELEFVEHVARDGVLVAHPLTSRSGALIEEIGGVGRRYYAVAFAGLQGQQPEADEMHEAMYRAWGQTLARIHQASQSSPPHAARPVWREQAQGARDRLPSEEEAIAHALDTGLVWYDTLPALSDTYGLLHGDCEADNLVWREGQWQVLDFESAAYGPYALDIVVALEDVLVGEDEAWVGERLNWFGAGYDEVRPLPTPLWDTAHRWLTLLTAMKAACLIQSYASTPASDESQPAWLTTMRERHLRWLATKRATLSWR
jgi:Ser/Thr protein kinase RdoA (MazF antagonist)